MAFDVTVIYMDNDRVTYPKVDRITEGPYALRLEVKRYPGVINGDSMKHVISIPYAAMAAWQEEDV